MADYEINWRPIETAPRDGTDVLIYYGGKDSHPSIGPCEAYWDGDCWITLSGEWGEMLGFWFWRPLIEPPVGDWEWPGGQGTAEQIKQYKALGEIAKSEPAKDEAALIKLIGQIIFYFGGEEEFFTENAESALDIIREQGWAVVPQTELEALRVENARLREALKNLLDRDERYTCQHEETHRGGFLWEICDCCGAKWADDMGGKTEWKDPPEWVAARAALEVKP